MSALLLTLLAGTTLVLLRGVLADELKGRCVRRLRRSVESSLAMLPATLRDELEEEVLADFDQLKTMPISAAQFARALRRDIPQLLADEGTPAHAATPMAGARPRHAAPRRDWQSTLDRWAGKDWVADAFYYLTGGVVIFAYALGALFRGDVAGAAKEVVYVAFEFLFYGAVWATYKALRYASTRILPRRRSRH